MTETTKKPGKIHLTKFEWEIMVILWEGGLMSVREIHEALPATRQLAYTTVQTIVHRLVEKGAVTRVKKIGNAFVFSSAMNRQSAFRRRIDELLEFLGGSPKMLVSHLVETGQLSLSDIQELENELKKVEKEQINSSNMDKNELKSKRRQ